MYSEDDLIPISTVQDYTFCPRRAALVMLERLWADNAATREGTHLHRKASRGVSEWVDGVLITRSLPLRSLQWGVIGVADVVEFHPAASETPPEEVISLTSRPGCWTVFPIEYKRGKLRHEASFIHQLCAQALCLEEMLTVHVPRGTIFFGKTRRRLDIEFTPALRQKTLEIVARIHQMAQSQHTPLAAFEKKCNFCAMYDHCSPQSLKSARSLQNYVASVFSDAVEETS